MQSDVDKKKQIQVKTKKIKMSGRDDEDPLADEEQDSSLSVTAKLHHEGRDHQAEEDEHSNVTEQSEQEEPKEEKKK